MSLAERSNDEQSIYELIHFMFCFTLNGHTTVISLYVLLDGWGPIPVVKESDHKIGDLQGSLANFAQCLRLIQND